MKQIKYINKLTASVTALLLAVSAAAPAFADGAKNTSGNDVGKEEVIYIIADASGKVEDIEAVNVFRGGDITDYGDYSSVKLLNTTDNITLSGDKVTFTSSADRVYYQGKLKNTSIPWDISIRYFMDGREYSAEEIAGKSGALEIRFKIEKNESFGGTFWDDYALQASFTLDTEKCANITAPDATVANVGSDKQLSYTILPGKGIDTVITADVVDFEMEAAAVNGVKMNLTIDIDDSAVTEKVGDIKTAAGELNDGASELLDGAGKLSDAASELSEKTGELHSGALEVSDGVGRLGSGLAEIAGKNGQLTSGAYAAYEGLCSAVSAALSEKLTANGMDAVTLTPTTYSARLGELLAKTDADAVYSMAYGAANERVRAEVESRADELYAGYIDANADAVCLAYVSSMADDICAQAASKAVAEQLAAVGYTAEQTQAYLNSPEGASAVSAAVSGMTKEERSQIISAAAAGLSDEEKAQIKAGAVSSLTDEEKAQIREGCVSNMMESDEVTAQINSAVSEAASLGEQIKSLKTQLDSFGEFYRGIVEYTGAVSDAANGSEELKSGIDKLCGGTEALDEAVKEFGDAVGELHDGTSTLADGTAEFVDKTSGIDTEVRDEIDSMTSSITGSGSDTVSFTSEKNENVDSVQFVIKTAAIEKPAAAVTAAVEEAPLTFWQKLLRLFGINK